MIVHTVLFKIKSGTPHEKIDEMIESLQGLKSIISELLELKAGKNFSTRNKGFDLMLYSRFKDPTSLQIYLDHPAHRRVIDEVVHPIREEVIVGDLEF